MMFDKTNTITPVKILPILSLLVVGLALTPADSMAGEKDHHKDKSKHAVSVRHDSKRHHGDKDRHDKHAKYARVVKNFEPGYRDHKHYRKHNDDHHVYYKTGHPHYRHGHGHEHVTYIINDHYYDDSIYALDPFRFMIGLHSDNMDVIFHD